MLDEVKHITVTTNILWFFFIIRGRQVVNVFVMSRQLDPRLFWILEF
jgi:hypothetical protein